MSDGGRLQHLVFDLDGTLVDSLPDIHFALNATLGKFSYPNVELNQTRSWIGNGAVTLVERALNYHQDAVAQTPPFQSVLDEFYSCYAACCGRHTRVFDGVIDGLKQLRSNGFLLSLCTNKPTRFTDDLLKSCSLAEFFSFQVCGDSLPTKKPDPEPLFWLCAEAGVKTSESIMIGDSVNDVRAAHAANMDVVCMSYGYNHGKSIAEDFDGVVLDHFSELPRWIFKERLVQ